MPRTPTSRHPAPSRRRALGSALLGALALVAATGVLLAQPLEAADQEPDLPKGLAITFLGQAVQVGDEAFFNGPVTVTWRGSRIQADQMRLRERRYIEAEGNVLVVWAGNRISGARMSYDLELERGFIEDAVGQVEDEYFFRARRAEKVGAQTIHLQSATITTCTQPTPYWSFSVSSATITIDHYARMWNLRLRGGPVPVFYLPYMVWPVKKDRAAGLLMPEFSTTQTRGNAISQELFVPLGRSADLTLLGRYYTEAGFGGGGELRYIPNRRGAAMLSGFYIFDKVSNAGRYRATYNQTQQFRNGFRMVADLNFVSDFDYFEDFERDLNIISSPTILARLEFSRNGPWTSMNVRELRREQLLANGSSLIQQTLPEVEWRGRSRQLGKTPFYLNYESSLASIQQRRDPVLPGTSSDYLRGDVAPTITVPWSPQPWVDITPRVSYRATHYTQRQAPIFDEAGRVVGQTVVDDPITRQQWSAGLDLIAPKIFRIYERPGNVYSPSYKHSIEGRISYNWANSFEESDQVIVFDEVDRFSAGVNLLNVGVVQRLFAKRPRRAPSPRAEDAGELVLPEQPSAIPTDQGRYLDDGDEQPLDEPAEEDAPLETVEIASLDISQARSFDTDLSFADLDRDGIIDATRRSSAVFVVGRYNPTPSTSLDLRTSYDTLYHDFSNVIVSGAFRNKLSRIRFSLVHNNPLGVALVGRTEPSSLGDRGSGTDGTWRAAGEARPLVANRVERIFTPSEPIFAGQPNDTQIRVTTGLTLFGGRLHLDLDGTINANPGVGQSRFPDRRWRIQYSNQCCTFLVERINRNYSSASSDRDDYYFRIDLKGIGKLIGVNY